MKQNREFTRIDVEGSSTTEHQEDESLTVQIEESVKQPTFKEKVIQALVMARPLITMLVVDVGLPLVIYYVLKIWLSILIALILSGIPPLVHVIYTFIRKRTVDMLGCIFVVSYIVSAVLSMISGNARLALLRDSSTTALISVMFFVTLIPLKTKWFTVLPMVFMITQQMFVNTPPFTWVDKNGQEQSKPVLDLTWENVRAFRRYCCIITFAWGVLLMGEFVAKIVMIQSTLDIDQVVLYGNIIIIVVVVVMTAATMLWSRSIRKISRQTNQEWLKANDYRDRLPL